MRLPADLPASAVSDAEAGPVANAVVIDPTDNVATVVVTLTPGTPVRTAGGAGPATVEAIPSGHKVALEPIAAGEPIVKYGHPIGRASEAIVAGSHVHTHNLTGQEV